MKDRKIVLIEDHHQALEAWRREKFKDLPLIHLDAHIDFWFYRAKPITQIMKEAKSIKEIQRQLEESLLYSKYKNDLETQLNIGNYIYPAMRDGLVGKFYWVVPGDRDEFERSLGATKRLTKRLKARDPQGESRINENSQRLTTRLYKNDFEVTSLSSLKRINEPVLLDIDLDFLLFDSIRRVSLTKSLGRRRPWIYPKELVSQLKKKLPKIAYATISYSVNGGYSPIEYKFFADEIALRLEDNLDRKLERIISLRNRGVEKYLNGDLDASQKGFEKGLKKLEDYSRLNTKIKPRFFAHLYFWLYNINWRLGKKEISGTYYKMAIDRDCGYRCRDNNLGWLYLMRRDLNSAKKEFEKICYCDEQDYFSLVGLGDVFYQRRKYRKSLKYYQQAFKINPGNKEAIFGMTNCQFALGRLDEAKKNLILLKKKEPLNEQTFFLEGRLCKRLGSYKKALLAYKEAVMLGKGNIELYNDVFNMLRVERDDQLFEFFKQRYESFKNYFYKYQKKILLKEKREDQFNRQAKSFERIDKRLKTLQAR